MGDIVVWHGQDRNLRNRSGAALYDTGTGTNTRLRDFKCVPVLNSFGGDGISTVCSSATPSGLTLAPD